MIIVERFAPEAKQLRAHFDARFADPRRADEGRFVWDYWHVPGQYSHLRTPAWTYFPPRLYERLHTRLVSWGRRTLGCHDISPPWLSCYIDGCGQELHGDLPHGPFAWVLSLTRWDQRTFSGGETLLLRDETLDYWRRFSSVRSIERAEVVALVPPRWNQLLIFDPRVPHGVSEVRGTRDPRHGRLVLHGWFVQPRPFIEGPLSVRELMAGVERLSETVTAAIDAGLDLQGLVSVRFAVAPDGRVRRLALLADTTKSPGEHDAQRAAFIGELMAAARALRFRHQRGPSSVTLPLLFEREAP